MTLPILHETPLPTRSRAVVVVAPYEDAGAHASQCIRYGASAIAIAMSHPPAAYAHAQVSSAYQHVITHDNRSASLRRTLTKLHALTAAGGPLDGTDITAVVPGSALGVPLAEQLAKAVGVPGNPCDSSLVRRDRGAQAHALATAQPAIAAPATLRTTSLKQAMKWARDRWLAALRAGELPQPCVVLPADSGVRAPARICRTLTQLREAWQIQRLAAWHQVEDAHRHVVVQEWVPGPQYVVHTVTSDRHDLTGAKDHAITHIWAEVRTTEQLHDRSYLLDLERMSPQLTALLPYVPRVLDALGVQSGAARCRIVHGPTERWFHHGHDRAAGPMLLSARVYPQPTASDHAVWELTGDGVIDNAVRHLVGAAGQRTRRSRPQHIMRMSLHAPHGGIISHPLWDKITKLDTLRAVVGPVHGGAVIKSLPFRVAIPGELVLAADDRRAVDRDYTTIRSLEADGLYWPGGAR